MSISVALAEIKAGEPTVFTGLVSTLFPPSRIYQWDAGNEPGPEQSLKHAAKSTGRGYMEVYYDWLVPPDGDEPGVLWKPLQAYQDGDFENLRSIHEHPLTVPGVSGTSKRTLSPLPPSMHCRHRMRDADLLCFTVEMHSIQMLGHILRSSRMGAHLATC